MSEILLKVGNDNGNSEHDIIINGKYICQPNVFSKLRKLPNLDEVNKEYVLDNIENNLIITCEDPVGIYYIGNYALKSSQKVRSIEVGIDNNKIDSDIIKVNTLAQIAGYAVAEYYKCEKNFNDTIKVSVDMSTALPISNYSHKASLEFADRFLSKIHRVTVHIGNMEARVEIKFEFVKVIPEGVTSIFALRDCDNNIFTDYNKKYNEKLDNKFFEKARVLHVAIGEGTTEFPITQGIEFNPEFIKGTNNGIGHAIDKAIEEFKTSKGLSKFSRQDYSNVLINENHKFHDVSMEIVEQYIQDEAEEILHHAKIEIQKANNEVDIVCVYGGGSILMRSELENKLKEFCERAKIKLLYISKEYAITLESKGLYNFTNSEIFEYLKNKYIG